eukprot:5375645-Pleurochrysis_carterae.AAC.1
MDCPPRCPQRSGSCSPATRLRPSAQRARLESATFNRLAVSVIVTYVLEPQHTQRVAPAPFPILSERCTRRACPPAQSMARVGPGVPPTWALSIGVPAEGAALRQSPEEGGVVPPYGRYPKWTESPKTK